MVERFFSSCQSIEDVKRTYHELVKRLHPDCGGRAEDFVAMYSEYERAYKRLRGIHAAASGETYTKTESTTTETPEQYADIIAALIHLDGIKIEIIGSWVWVSGSTYTYREQLKELGFFYSGSKKAWYYTGEDKKSHRRGHYTMEQIRARYGSDEIATSPRVKIA